eukprot:CAMPEP_0171255728 /NCGR_PEP_ID=MMETSP0790-20130122/52919_1 /TAXON_ID=2925 /ORGANISM="Alexandrium catenella, Strain OF101" /LENGTH=59 /DNA_ID=CAMNT_0011723695 /DNA_START=29 /DNA_END=205 /DNA_ORIENTATION=+
MKKRRSDCGSHQPKIKYPTARTPSANAPSNPKAFLNSKLALRAASLTPSAVFPTISAAS